MLRFLYNSGNRSYLALTKTNAWAPESVTGIFYQDYLHHCADARYVYNHTLQIESDRHNFDVALIERHDGQFKFHPSSAMLWNRKSFELNEF